MLNLTTNATVGFAEYEKFVNETAIHRDYVYPILGLAGETGEFVELVKKAWRTAEGDPPWMKHIPKEKVASELGDILWYVTRVAALTGVTLEEIVQNNIEKLTNRKKYGKESEQQ